MSAGDDTIVVVDSRKPEWLEFSGMIEVENEQSVLDYYDQPLEFFFNP